MLKQDPVELLRKLDELRDQITRSCQIIGQPRERRRVNRRVLSLLPEHPEPPSPSCGPGYHHVHHAGRYGHQLPPIPSGPLRPAHGERYGRQPSARCRQYPGRHWENCGFGHGDYHHNMCTCAHCLHGQQAAVREEHIPMARYFAGQHECYRFERSPSVSSDYDQRSVASSLYSHRSVSKRRAEYFRKKAENLCRPVRGAAPFVVCSSCYQLLQVPLGKCTGRKQSRLQCGSCSEMVSFQHEEAKISPYIPSESFPDSKTEQSSNDQMRPDFEHQHHDDVNSVFCNLKEHNSMQINIDFADDNSLSSTTSHDRIDKECGSYRSIQSKVEGPSVSPSRAGDVESPKDILCERDADCQVEPSVDGLISSRSPVLEDKLVDPLCSQEKDDNVVDQRTTNRYDQNCKGEYIANVEDVIISVGSEQMSKEDGKCALEDESMSRRYEEKSKEDDSISLEDGNKKFEQKSTQDDISTLEDGNTKYEWKCKEDDTNSFIDESVNKVDELKSKEDGKNDLEAENIGKKYDESNEEDANSALEGESTSKKHEQRNIEDDNGKLQQSCIEDPNALADTGSSVNECANSGFSRGSSEAGLDEDQSSTGRSGDSSFFAGFLKKGFKDLSLFNQSMDSVKVSINGHPISERALKKAEKKAGPVEPGSYWYDYRVGFWGVMGRECIGIIPPFIREFNYPMARNCAGGNTGVFVNGRELHQRDLDLLVGRGLPRISGKSYSIEISGNVTDETIGKKLRGLGKLAPTIEKLKRGFGMHVPEEFG